MIPIPISDPGILKEIIEEALDISDESDDIERYKRIQQLSRDFENWKCTLPVEL